MLKIINSTLGRIYHPILHNLRLKKEQTLIRNALETRLVSGNFVKENLDRKKKIYIDLSDVFFSDKGTGIQRVAKNIAQNIEKLATEYEIDRVYFKESWYFSCESGKEIDFCSGDIFFILDQPIRTVCNSFNLFIHLMNNGVKVVSFFHDLIPITHPKLCATGYVKDFKIFLSKILFFSQIICNSKSTAEELSAYLAEHPKIKRNPNIKISYSLLGCDFSSIKNDTTEKVDITNQTTKANVNFLMVSTVEPRKMYDQAVKAFDILWKKGLSVNLWIVGRPGWKNKKTFKLIEENPHFGTELVWYNTGISDKVLAVLYEKCNAVIFASLSEGFGLAVAEGAYHKKPLILRDLPVFREIAGNNAFYFTGAQPELLAEKIEEWLLLYKTQNEPKSENIKLTSWMECSQKVLNLLTENGEIK